jgi:hypothetical protein
VLGDASGIGRSSLRLGLAPTHERAQVNETGYEPDGPRGLTRMQEWLRPRVRRIPPEAWPFILLAVFAVAANGPTVLSSGSLELLFVPYIAVEALIPAAILVGAHGKWRSARLLLLGAIVWTSVPLGLGVISWAYQWLALDSMTDGSLGSVLQIARDLADLVSLAGPALVAVALMERRLTETTWPKALVALALIATGALCLIAANNVISVGSGSPIGVDPDYPWFVAVVSLRPLQILTLGALAWSTLAAVRAREEPRRFWMSVFGGSAVMLGMYILLSSLSLAMASPALGSDTFAFLDQIVLVDILGGLVGMLLLLIGFAQGLPAVVAMAGGGEPVPTLAH